MSADSLAVSVDVERVREPFDVIDVEFWSPTAEICGVVRWEIDAAGGATRVLVIVDGRTVGTIVMSAPDLPIPRNALSLRGPGVWCELVCETPLAHWTVGLEAFGVAINPTDSISPDVRGTVTPLGLDLDLETRVSEGGADVRFEHGLLTVGLRVSGQLLVADVALEVDGAGRRRRGGEGLANEGQADDLPKQFEISELRRRVAW